MKYREKSKFFRGSVSWRITSGIVFVFFALLALSYLYILFWGFTSSLKTHNEIVMEPFGLPHVFNFQNYIEVFSRFVVNKTDFIGMLFNSLYFTVFGAILAVLTTSGLAYVTCRYKFFGSRVYFYVTLIVITLPIYGTGGSLYMLYSDLGLINNRLFVLLNLSGINIYYMYFYAFYKNLSWSYAEAAFIDGANDFTVYFKVMLPQSITMLGACFLLIWMSAWGEYGGSLLYLPKMPMLAAGLYLFNTEMKYIVRLDILYAGCMLTALPSLILFVAFNGTLMSNLSLGGVKE